MVDAHAHVYSGAGSGLGNDSEWSLLQSTILRQLAREYKYILAEFRVQLRPVSIQLFESSALWGKWDPLVRTIFISKKLLESQTWFSVVNILKHEMAHQWVDESPESIGSKKRGRSGDGPRDRLHDAPHGELFLEACEQLRVPEEFRRHEVRLQDTELDWRNMSSRDERVERLLDKTRKLLALATSSNENEALLAMSKVRELYAKYNLDEAQVGKRAYSQLRIEIGKARMEDHTWRIQSLLCSHFMVDAIALDSFDLKLGIKTKAVELVGTRENLLMAEYVFHFLHQQLDFWVREQAKRRKGFSRIERRSFRVGILEGFSDKLSAMERAPIAPYRPMGSPPRDAGSTEVSVVANALKQFEDDADQKRFHRWLHPRFTRRFATGRGFDAGSYQTGHQIGRSIHLRRGLETSGGGSGRVLGHSKAG